MSWRTARMRARVAIEFQASWCSPFLCKGGTVRNRTEFNVFMALLALLGLGLATREVLAGGSTAPGCESASLYQNNQLVGFNCTTITCSPPPCLTGNYPSGPTGSTGYLSCFCGIGSPDNVCGRDVQWTIDGAVTTWVDVGCSGPCPGTLRCITKEPAPFPGGQVERGCLCTTPPPP